MPNAQAPGSARRFVFCAEGRGQRLAPTEKLDELLLPRPGSSKYPPELIEWAVKQVSEEEIIAGYQEIQKNGGLELHEFIEEIEKEALPHE